MHYNGKYDVFDPNRISTYPLSTRTNKVTLKDLVSPADIDGLAIELPDKTCACLETIARAIVSARRDDKPVIFFTGAHLIKNGLGPLLTGLLAALLIREPMSRRQIGGAIVGMTGVIVLISKGSLAFWQVIGNSVGDLVALGAVSLWGLYSILGRQAMRHRSALSATALSAFLGLPFLLLAALWEVQTLAPNVQSELVAAVLYIGVFPTVIGFLSWNAGVQRLGPSGAMVFYNTLPLYGALIGYLFLDEPIKSIHLLGGALIIGGGLWAATGHG